MLYIGGFVMELMEEFEVAFAPEQPEAEGQPKESQRWLIPGLLPRLIVRTHELSEAHTE
jgi:hypothetical protein